MNTKELQCWTADDAIDEAIENYTVGEAATLELDAVKAAEMFAQRAEYWAGEIDAIKAKYAKIINAYHAELGYAEQRQSAAKQLITTIFRPAPDAEICGEFVRLFYTTSHALQITNAEAIPIDYVRMEAAIDNRAIKDALKEGKEVPGAILEQRYHLQIKPGGHRGERNAAQRHRRAPKIVEMTKEEKK